MPTYNIGSDDTFTLNGRIFNDFADGDNIKITPKTDTVNAKTGKNKNTSFNKNAEGDNADIVIRLMRGSGDDQFLQGMQASSDVDFPSTVLMNGEFVKRLGDGQGNVSRDVSSLSGVIIKRRNDSMENVEGQTEQSIVIWTLFAASYTRSTQ